MQVLSTQCPNLYKLKIEENEIDSPDKFKCLTNLNLKKINLLGNPLVEKDKDYSKIFFDMFKNMESVDDKDRDGQEVESTVYGGEDDEDYEEGEDAEDDGEVDDDDGEGGEVDDDDDEEEEKEGNKNEAKKGNNKKKKTN